VNAVVQGSSFGSHRKSQHPAASDGRLEVRQKAGIILLREKRPDTTVSFSQKGARFVAIRPPFLNGTHTVSHRRALLQQPGLLNGSPADLLFTCKLNFVAGVCLDVPS
jgi:hypothetical protein